MARITLHGEALETVGELPKIGAAAPPFSLTKTDLAEVSNHDFAGKAVVLNIFPSIDTPVCAASVRRFNQEAANREGVAVLCVSADLPFAHGRFCEVEGLNNVIAVSVFRSPAFGLGYGVTIASGVLRGLLSRAIVIIDKGGKVAYAEQVPEIAQEPDYAAALAALAKIC
ncbi:MAG: thiol peroxidase [Thermodesulfobacteriota bacterium]